MNTEKWNSIRAKQSPVLRNKQCAVLVPLIESNGNLGILFEVRSSKLSWQPGDICFPGGGRENTDISFEHTAVRETMEELGTSKKQIEILGRLDYVESPVGVTVWPFVGIIEAGCINISKQEVQEIFIVPVQWFLAHDPERFCMEIATRPATGFPDAIAKELSWQWRKRSSYDIYMYQYENKTIWGITAHIVKNFISQYRRIEMI